MQCINCANEIQAGAKVCPYCHLHPYDAGATQPYTNIDRGGGVGSLQIDPVALGVIGAIVLPALVPAAIAVPVAGLALLGAGIIAKFKRR